MNSLGNAVSGLAMALKGIAGESVVYSRGALKSESISAVRAVQTYEVMDDQGFMVSVQSTDFIFTAADLLIDEKVIEPRPGDQILSGNERFETLPLGKRPCVEAHDPSGLMVVVHTKKVAK